MKKEIKQNQTTANVSYGEAVDLVRSFLERRYQENIPLAYVHTYGCQQNVSDGEKSRVCWQRWAMALLMMCEMPI